MDAILFVTAIILIFLICIVFVLNFVGTTTDIEKIYKILTNNNPAVVGFSLGKNKTTGKFTNVVTDADGKLQIRSDNQPIHINGQFITYKPHGDVVPNEKGAGFKVSGFNENAFECPSGYEGVECKPKSLCDAQDVGTFKALTYSQFNDLSAYTNISDKSNEKARGTTNDDVDVNNEPTHPRIRLFCKDAKGNYELQACPDNQLLDANLKCINYDVCIDRVNGYKHNMPTASGRKLLKNEYYICENNRSKLMKCENNTVFSAKNYGCIVESQCFNRGHTTIPLNDESYIECNHDVGKIIKCEHGVRLDTETNLLNCRNETYKDKRLTMVSANLKYDYGVIYHENGETVRKVCSTTTNKRRYPYTFNNKTMYYELENWPVEVLNEKNECVPPTDDIIVNPTIYVNWANLMQQPHSFDVKKKKFICPEFTTYVTDYANNRIETNEFNFNGHVNIMVPCNDRLLDVRNTIFDLMPIRNGDLNIFYYENLVITKDLNLTPFAFWPVKIDKSFYMTNIVVNDKSYSFTTYRSEYPPYNFSDRHGSGFLPYIPFSFDPTETANTRYYWFIENNRLVRPTMYNTVVHHSMVFPKTFNNFADIKSSFCALFIRDPSKRNSKVQIDKGEIVKNGYFICNVTTSNRVTKSNCGQLGDFRITAPSSKLTFYK